MHSVGAAQHMQAFSEVSLCNVYAGKRFQKCELRVDLPLRLSHTCTIVHSLLAFVYGAYNHRHRERHTVHASMNATMQPYMHSLHTCTQATFRAYCIVVFYLLVSCRRRILWALGNMKKLARKCTYSLLYQLQSTRVYA